MLFLLFFVEMNDIVTHMMKTITHYGRTYRKIWKT